MLSTKTRFTQPRINISQANSERHEGDDQGAPGERGVPAQGGLVLQVGVVVPVGRRGGEEGLQGAAARRAGREGAVVLRERGECSHLIF